MKTKVNISLPLPLDLASSLMGAVGKIYPNTTIGNNSGRELVLYIDDKDRYTEEALDGIQAAERLSEADAEAMLVSIVDGSYGLSMPEFFSTLVAGAMKEILESMEAENYVSFEVRTGDSKSYVVTACRSLEQSPHELRKEADAKAKRYADKLRELGVDPDTI